MSAQRGAEIPVPPDPPPMDRRVRIDRMQLISMSIMALIAVLALSGLLGESTSESRSTDGALLALQISYPSRLHYHQRETLGIAVQNASPGSLEAVSLAIDRRYLEAFSVDTIVPDTAEVTQDAYVIRLGALSPGQVRRVALQVEAEHHGHHEGLVVARAGDQELGRASLATYVFP